MTETLANGYPSESTQRELSYEYPHDLVMMIFIIICFFVHWTKINSAANSLRVLSCFEDSVANWCDNATVGHPRIC